MWPTLPPWYSHNDFGGPNSFNHYDTDVILGGVSTPTSTQYTPHEDTSDEQGFSGDLHTPSHSIGDGLSGTGYMPDYPMSDLVSPWSADHMTAIIATFVDEQEPKDLRSRSDHPGINEANAGTLERDLMLRSARPSVQGIVFYSLLDITINIIRYSSSYRLHADSTAKRRNDLSQRRHISVVVHRVHFFRRNSINISMGRARIYMDIRRGINTSSSPVPTGISDPTMVPV